MMIVDDDEGEEMICNMYLNMLGSGKKHKRAGLSVILIDSMQHAHNAHAHAVSPRIMERAPSTFAQCTADSLTASLHYILHTYLSLQQILHNSVPVYHL